MSAWPTAAERDSVVARVELRAQTMSPGAAVRRVLVGLGAVIINVLFCIGWVSAKILRGLWLSVAWVFAALAEGFAAGIHSAERARAD